MSRRASATCGRRTTAALFDVRVEPSPDNLAYTSREILPHTDNPYRDPVPTIQLLHCLRTADDGGDTGLVDGFCAAAALRAADRGLRPADEQRRLVRLQDKGAELRASQPLIQLSPRGRVRGVRFNNRSAQPLRLPYADITALLCGLPAVGRTARAPQRRLNLRLAPGDCLIFDNTRILHARTAFSLPAARTSQGRHLQGCYADLDGLASTLAVLSRPGTTCGPAPSRKNMTAIEIIGELFAGPGARAYLGEPVTIGTHMLQAGALAEAAGADRPLVAAALLHDIGHLREETDARHGEAGAHWLSQWFGEEVTEPVRLHVAAKRYLCASSPATSGCFRTNRCARWSRQGGPMTPEEAAEFEALPHAKDAVAVRRWDDQAKDPAVTPPSFAHFAELLGALLRS